MCTAALQSNLTVYNTVINMNVTEAKCPNVTVTGVAEQELLTASELD